MERRVRNAEWVGFIVGEKRGQGQGDSWRRREGTREGRSEFLFLLVFFVFLVVPFAETRDSEIGMRDGGRRSVSGSGE
jgi:hypothetical protein